MGTLIRVDARICASCRYRQGFGSQPGKEQTEAGHNMNFACNYQKIEGHSRIFVEGKLAYDPKFCDKYKRGRMILPEQEEERTFEPHSQRYRKKRR